MPDSNTSLVIYTVLHITRSRVKTYNDVRNFGTKAGDSASFSQQRNKYILDLSGRTDH